MLKFLFLLFLTLTLNARTFTIASYNVENLFDLEKHKSEYKEFSPNTKSNWNQKIFNIKLNNVAKVIREIDADIIGLQEIENKAIMQLLLKKIPEYKYYSFAKYPRSAVGVGFLSKIEIKDSRQIDVKFTNKIFRPIQETTFELNNIEFKVFNNHWPSKAVAESYRIKYAKTLQNRLSTLPRDYDYILLGDFNSNYDEMQSFRGNKKLNNSSGITGINQVLNTTINGKYITYDDVLKSTQKVHFNLWLDLPSEERFSNKFRKQSNTPDNMIIAPALLDTKRISYINHSFSVFKPDYLYKNNIVNRWKMSGSKYNKTHKGEGFSDHLPILAKFSTLKESTNPLIEIKRASKKELNSIFDLYERIKLTEPIKIVDATVIYKINNSAIIKREDDRAVYLFNCANDLKVGYTYDLQINQITDYNGLKEVDDISILSENKRFPNYSILYLDSKKIDILDSKYQNEIITNLQGTMKKNKLYFGDRSIKLYSKDKSILPKDGEKITIVKGHLGVYRGNTQILIHRKDDYKIGF